jgi:diguanylate cyclase (GGDEF)-like protein
MPRTEWATVLCCIVGLTAYVLEVGNIAFYRNAQLRVTREQLKLRERALVDANERLQHSLQEIEILRKDLAEQASRDPLTNLYNRRHLAAALPREMQRCQREAKPVALIIMDLDHFKKFNDHYGHSAGDACLRAVSQAIQASAKRSGDLAARYGGEEFLLVLPDTNEGDALGMADALRAAVEALDIAHAQSSFGRVTLSLGVAVSRPDQKAGAEPLLRSADMALYAAKEAGRNRAHLASTILVTPSQPARFG